MMQCSDYHGFAGHVEVEQATYNCLQSIEYAGTYQPPIYKGAKLPILKEYKNTIKSMGRMEWGI